MTAALILIAGGIAAATAFHGWWRNPDDLILTGLRKAAAVVSTLFAKEA
jgi:hypothetical protein